MLPDAPAPESPDQVPVWRGLALGFATVLGVGILLLAFALVFVRDDGPDAQTYQYVIPAGTGVRVDQGETFYELFPDYLALRVGDRLVVKNRDDRTHTLGVFTVRAGETLDFRFDEAGIYKGECSLHGPDHDAVIEVT